MTLTEAVQKFVHEGSTVAFGGMGGTQCVAHAYEIARQRIGNLTLICESPAEPAKASRHSDRARRARRHRRGLRPPRGRKRAR